MTYIAICSEQYLNYYRELYKSLKEHSPHSKQIIYYIGTNETYLREVFGKFDESMYITDWYNDCDPSYDKLTAICSLRARVVLETFKSGNKDKLENEHVIFCGAKIKFLRPPDILEMSLNKNKAVVTPHITKPLPEDGQFPSNEQVSFTGHVSTDLVGFRNHPDVVEFLEWQDEIMKTKCKTSSRTYLDQSWLNFLPFFVDQVEILHDTAYNIAYWNYKQRNFSKIYDQWTVEDKYGFTHKAVCFQFSGLDPNHPELISKHQSRDIATGDLLEFLTDYAEKVK